MNIDGVREAAYEWADNMAAQYNSKNALEWLHWLREALFADHPELFPIQGSANSAEKTT